MNDDVVGNGSECVDLKSDLFNMMTGSNCNYHDVTFEIGQGLTPTNLHRCILSARCVYFKMMFENNPEKKIFRYPYINKTPFNWMIEYLYTGCIGDFKSLSKTVHPILVELMALSVEFIVPKLYDLCVSCAVQQMWWFTLKDMLFVSSGHRPNVLHGACGQYIRKATSNSKREHDESEEEFRKDLDGAGSSELKMMFASAIMYINPTSDFVVHSILGDGISTFVGCFFCRLVAVEIRIEDQAGPRREMKELFGVVTKWDEGKKEYIGVYEDGRLGVFVTYDIDEYLYFDVVPPLKRKACRKAAANRGFTLNFDCYKYEGNVAHLE